MAILRGGVRIGGFDIRLGLPPQKNCHQKDYSLQKFHSNNHIHSTDIFFEYELVCGYEKSTQCDYHILIQNQYIFLTILFVLQLGNKLLHKLNLSCEKYRKLIRLINNYSEFNLGNVTYIQYLWNYEEYPET